MTDIDYSRDGDVLMLLQRHKCRLTDEFEDDARRLDAEFDALRAEVERLRGALRASIEQVRLTNEERVKAENIAAEKEGKVQQARRIILNVPPGAEDTCVADWLARTAPKEQCRVDVGGYPCEEQRPCPEHDGTAPKEAKKPQHRYAECVCSNTDPHFVPPSFGEAGFYACDPDRWPARTAPKEPTQ